jgi:hypothetical protein
MRMAKRRVELHIRVFGASSGESIVLQLPDRTWAVVDCFATSPNDTRTNPAYQFLVSQGVQSLEFLCLTHPHADHFMGMGRLIRDLQIKAFWAFGGLLPPDFELLRTFFEGDAQTSRLPDSRAREREISTIFDTVRTKGIRHQSVAARTLIYPSIGAETNIQIWGIAPSGRHINEYKLALLNSFKGKHFKSALPQSDHNLISSAFLVKFGETRIILGGDVERCGWQDVLDDNPGDLSSHAVKVPHHGSKNGYCPSLWDRFSFAGKPIAILTPFAPKSLPNRDALDHIHARTSAIHSAAVTRHNPLSYPTLTDPRLARIRATLISKAKARQLKSTSIGGFCHLVFDNQGRYTLIENGEAGRIC